MPVATHTVDLHDVRVAGSLMLAAGALRPFVGSPGIACPLRTLTGIPCPLCGMTTSVTATVHGHVGAALHANPAGIVAVAVAALLLVRRDLRSVTLPPWSLPATLAAMWLFELFRYSIL